MKSSAIILPYRSKINNPYLTKQKINPYGLQGSSAKIVESEKNVHKKNKSKIKSNAIHATSSSHLQNNVSLSNNEDKARFSSNVKQNKDSDQVALKKYEYTTKKSKSQKSSATKMKKIKSFRDRLKMDLEILRKKEIDRNRMKQELEKKKNELVVIQRKTLISSNKTSSEDASNVIESQKEKLPSLESGKKSGAILKTSTSSVATYGTESNKQKTKTCYATSIKHDESSSYDNEQINDKSKNQLINQSSIVLNKSISLDKICATDAGPFQGNKTNNLLFSPPQSGNKKDDNMNGISLSTESESTSPDIKRREVDLCQKNDNSTLQKPISILESGQKKEKSSSSFESQHSHEYCTSSHLIEKQSPYEQTKSSHPIQLKQSKCNQKKNDKLNTHDMVRFESKVPIFRNNFCSNNLNRQSFTSHPCQVTNVFENSVPKTTKINDPINISNNSQLGVTNHEGSCINVQRSNRQDCFIHPLQKDYKNEIINHDMKTYKSNPLTSSNTTTNNPFYTVRDFESVVTSSIETSSRSDDNLKRFQKEENTNNQTNVGIESEISREKSEPRERMSLLSFEEERKRAARAYALGLEPNNAISKTVQRTAKYAESTINTHHPLYSTVNASLTSVQAPILFRNGSMLVNQNQINSRYTSTVNLEGKINEAIATKANAIGIYNPQIPIQNSPFTPNMNQTYYHQTSSFHQPPIEYKHPKYYTFPQTLSGPLQQTFPTYPFNPFYHLNMQQFSRYFTPQQPNSLNTMPSSEPFKPKLELAVNPMETPSPWTKTHEYFETKIVLKKALGGSFGFTVQYKTRTALVARIDDNNEVRNNETCDAANMKKRKPRRKRKSFGVVEITKTGDQINYHEIGRENSVVKVNDIVLTVNGIDVGGKEFPDVVKMFSSESHMDKDKKWVICEIKVARLKVKRKAILKNDKAIQNSEVIKSEKQSLLRIPFVLNPNGDTITSGDFSKEEMNAFIHGMQLANIMQLVQDYKYIHEEIWDIVNSLPNCKLTLEKRNTTDLKKKWDFETKILEQRSQKRANTFWKQSSIGEKSNFHEMETLNKNEKLKLNTMFMSDANISKLLALPRPVKGCKCGSVDHDRVNHRNCILFRSLRQRYGSQMKENFVAVNDTTLKNQYQITNKNGKRCSAIQKSQNEKMKKIKLEYEADREEALFVESIEKIQMHNKQAIFAPTHLTVMVISAVAVLSTCVKDTKIDENESGTIINRVENEREKTNDSIADNMTDDESSSDEDDDVLLVSLKSRESTKEKEDIQTLMKIFEVYNDNEDEKTDMVTISKILLYISQTWGHVFTEPSHLDYAWRWTMHALNFPNYASRNRSLKRNPREPGTNSFENIKFGELSMNNIDSSSKKVSSSSMKLYVTDMMSSKTGLLDEIYCLIKSRIINISMNGSLSLTEHWYENVDATILNEMHTQWGSQKDPEGKFLISSMVKDKLEKVWKKNEVGWVRSDTETLVYDCRAIDRIKEKFTVNYETLSDGHKGIGKFGV